MRQIVTKIILPLILFGSTFAPITACARYKIMGSSNNKKSVPDNSQRLSNDPGGNESQNGNTARYDSKDGTLVLIADPNTTQIGMNIHFTAQCYDNRDVNVTWNFADGSETKGLDVQYAYRQSGTFRVTAVCTANGSDSRSGFMTINIKQSSNIPNPGGIPSQN